MKMCVEIPVEIPKKRPAGRPPRGPLEKVRTSFWAYAVKETSGKSFSAIERELSPETMCKRDGGRSNQPNRWYKYANGNPDPASSQKDKIASLIRAEKRYPGTARVYHSVTWDLLYAPEDTPLQPQRLAHRISRNVTERIQSKDIEKRTPDNILLTPQGIQRIIVNIHIDTLGLLLMQWRNGTPERLSVELIYFTRLWLLLALNRGRYFAKCRTLFLSLIEEHVPELGALIGPDGLDPRKSADIRLHDAMTAGFGAGIVSLAELAYIVRQNGEYALRDFPSSF